MGGPALFHLNEHRVLGTPGICLVSPVQHNKDPNEFKGKSKLNDDVSDDEATTLMTLTLN